MRKTPWTVLITLLLAACGSGCQLINKGTEVRTDEQMLRISFENAKAEELFGAIIYGTERSERTIRRIGAPSFSLYSRYETVSFNAHCNDHIRAMDKNADLLLSQKEAEDYYRLLFEQGKIVDRK